MNFLKWFDPHSREHIEAYNTLCTRGWWPEGFIPKDVVMPDNWHVSLTQVMTDCWVKYIMKEKTDA